MRYILVWTVNAHLFSWPALSAAVVVVSQLFLISETSLKFQLYVGFGSNYEHVCLAVSWPLTGGKVCLLKQLSCGSLPGVWAVLFPFLQKNQGPEWCSAHKSCYSHELWSTHCGTATSYPSATSHHLFSFTAAKDRMKCSKCCVKRKLSSPNSYFIGNCSTSKACARCSTEMQYLL